MIEMCWLPKKNKNFLKYKIENIMDNMLHHGT
jgi:hypothetical protein